MPIWSTRPQPWRPLAHDLVGGALDVVDDPFWQVLVIALGLAVAAAMVMMGYWQLEVYRNQGQAAAERRAAAPPVPISSVARAGAPVKDGYGRSVTVEGSYDPALQLLVPVEDRTDQFRVLSGLRQPDGSLVAVVRGVVFETATAPTPPSSPVHQVGVLLPSEEHVPETDLSSGQLASGRLPALAQQWPGPMIDGFVTLSSADASKQQLAPAEWRLRRRAAGCVMGRTRCSGGCSPRSRCLCPSG